LLNFELPWSEIGSRFFVFQHVLVIGRVISIISIQDIKAGPCVFVWIVLNCETGDFKQESVVASRVDAINPGSDIKPRSPPVLDGLTSPEIEAVGQNDEDLLAIELR
jgi:hypothetical protein